MIRLQTNKCRELHWQALQCAIEAQTLEFQRTTSRTDLPVLQKKIDVLWEKNHRLKKEIASLEFY